MGTWVIEIPEEMVSAITDDTAGAIVEFLAEHGVHATGVSIMANEQGDPHAVSITADKDPRPALATFTPDYVSLRVRQLREGLAILDTYAGAVEAGQQPTNAQTASTLRVLIRVLFDIFGDDPRIKDILT